MDRSPHLSGVVQDKTLTYYEEDCQVTIAVGTPAWQTWLENASSFTFRSEEGSFTAQKLRASNGRGGWYWYAYRRRQGHLSNFYLGTSTKLTQRRLDEAARTLARSGPKAAGHTPDSDSDTSLLLLSKLSPPHLSTQHISRPRLLGLLDEGARRALTLVSAPAGSGKTTLLAEWAATTSHPLVWISLEASDNDPARFLSYLLVALARLHGKGGTSTRTLSVHQPERALTAALNELTRSLQGESLVLLDDYHLLTSESVHALLRFLLDHLPERLHLVIGSRVDPALPLALLRARNQLCEIRASDLRFLPEEVEELTRTMGLTLSSEATSLLEQHAEGWIVGVQLIALALQGKTNVTEFLRNFHGTHRFLLDYVSEQILNQLAPDIQHFLLRTCILSRMTGSLCEALTDQPGGQARLRELQRANLFVSALDDAETWYRYHALFAETLRAQLQKLEPALLPELYLRASSWYEEHQETEEACDYALLAGDFARAASLIAADLPQMLEQGRIEQLSRWLNQIPVPLIASSPQLYIVMPWLHQALHESHLPEQREQAFRRMQQHVRQQQRDAGASWVEAQSVLTLFQALDAMSQNNMARTFALMRKALRALTSRQTALGQLIARFLRMALSVMYGASGDLVSAEQILLDLSVTQSEQAFSLVSLSALFLLGELSKAQGKLRKADTLYRDTINRLGSYPDLPRMPLLVMGFMLLRKTLLLYEWNRLEDAANNLPQMLEVIPRALPDIIPRTSQPVLVAFGFWVKARIEWAQGRPEAARSFLELVRSRPDIMQEIAKEKPPVRLSVLAARLALSCGDLAEADSWMQSAEISFADAPETLLEGREVFAYFTLARVLIARGRNYHDEAALSQALTLLEHWRTLAEHLDFQGWLIEVQMLTALALQAQGKTPQALTTLTVALELAEPEGYIRLFADEGEPMAALLTSASVFPPALRAYIQRLQRALISPYPALPVPPAMVTTHTLLDPLSKREQEVLALLAAGASNQQIADALVISLHTAKRHVKNILAKLDASNRTGAVARARELHLC